MIPFFTFLIMSVQAFAPVVYFMILETQGYLMYLTRELTGIYEIRILNFIMLLIGILVTFTFYLTNKLGLKIVLMMLSHLFLISFMFNEFGEFDAYNYPYFMSPLIQSSAITLPMLVIGYILENMKS